MKIIDKKEFAAAALNENDGTFVVHVAALTTKMTIHPSREAQIGSLSVEEVTVPPGYSDFADGFSKDSAVELPDHTGTNNHAIDLVDDKQPLFGVSMRCIL